VRPSGLELVKNVIVRNRREESGFCDSERLDQPDILRCSPDPSGRLDGSAGCITLLNGAKSVQIVFPVDEELCLTYCARSSCKPAEQVVDSETLFGGQRQPSLLSVPVSCLGCPDFIWKAGGPLRPAITGEPIFGKLCGKRFSASRNSGGSEVSCILQKTIKRAEVNIDS
jgi:hypothetical protein